MRGLERVETRLPARDERGTIASRLISLKRQLGTRRCRRGNLSLSWPTGGKARYIRGLRDGFFCRGKAGESRPEDDDAGEDVRRRFSLLLSGAEEEEGESVALPAPFRLQPTDSIDTGARFGARGVCAYV